MNKRLVTLLLAMVMILSQAVVFAENVDYAVQINSGGNVLELTLDELKAMPEEAHIDEVYVYNSKSGEKSVQVKGISLAYILEEVAEITETEGTVEFEALDAYPIDSQTLEDLLNDELKYVVAYEVDGEAVDQDDIPETDDITVYRKVKEEGEFNTVFKMVYKITIVGAETEETTEEPVEEQSEDPLEETSEEPAEDVTDVTFTDITEDFKFAEIAIVELAKKGIINGMGSGLYEPAGEFTRAQFCKVMVESLGYEQKAYTGGFSDVAATDWHAPYVQAAVESGLFNGYPEGDFKPNQSINRQEMASVAGRAAVLAEKVAQEKLDKFAMEKSNFADKALVQEWAANEVAWLEAEGVFSEIAPENFEPAKVVNRAEAALIVYNTLFK